MGNTGYLKKRNVKEELLERTITAMFELAREKNYRVSDIERSEIKKYTHMDRSVFYRNFRGIGGVQRATNAHIESYIRKSIGPTENLSQLTYGVSVKLFSCIKYKQLETNFAIESQNREYWISALLPLKPAIVSTWPAATEQCRHIAFVALSSIFAELVVAWRHHLYSSDLLDICTQTFIAIVRITGTIIPNLNSYISAYGLF